MKKEVQKIQKYLSEKAMDAYLIFTNDDHGSEYVQDYFKARAFVSGFTGSAGTLLITKEEAFLWTDGRYFLQASQQLKNTGIQLMRMGEPSVPSIPEYLRSRWESPIVAFDFTIATVSFVDALCQAIPSVRLVDDSDLMNSIWLDRPAKKKSPAYMIPASLAGKSVSAKLRELRQDMENEHSPYALITSLDDIAWLMNLRGDDITYNPVNYAFALISQATATLYIDSEKVSTTLLSQLKRNGIQCAEYCKIYEDLPMIQEPVLLDRTKTNYRIYALVRQRVEVCYFPTTVRKAVKNPVEIRNLKQAHIQDGVAMVRFLYELKSIIGKKPMTEISVSDRLEAIRRENPLCKDLSFGTICGYNAHGAIIHYGATPETDIPVEKHGFLLVDSGAQYTGGTTDITRTISLGRLSAEMKRNFTLVLKSHIALETAVFPEGTNGYVLDMLARQPLYSYGLDFRHGTGHGVGYMLNVHEGPQRITLRSWNDETSYPLQPGMVTSDEPGLYFDGKYGIRHENLVLCVPKMNTEYGRFLAFEPLTYVPFDLDAIDSKLLSTSEKNWLNHYHRQVYQKLSPYLSGREKKFLEKATRPL